MNSELQAIADSWTEDKASRDHAATIAMADAYVAAHPEEFTDSSVFSETDNKVCVNAIDVLRAAGWTEQVWRMQVWIWHKFDLQNIGGAAAASVRIPPAAPATAK